MVRRRVIALLLNNAGLRDDYQGNLRRGVERACIERDLDLWVYAGRTDFGPSGGAQLRVFQFLSSNRVDGIVIAAGCFATSHTADGILENLRQRCSVPICIVGQKVTGAASLVVDNQEGAAALTTHLVIDHARRNLVYIGGPKGHQESEERLNGIRGSLERHDLPLALKSVFYGDFMIDTGRVIARSLVESGSMFDALVVANDDMARGTIETLGACGYRCPQDVAVVGFDDAPSARISQPSLTTVRQPVARLGALAVARIVAAWRGKDSNKCISLSTDLVMRESCGCHTVGMALSQSRPSMESRRLRSRKDEVIQLLASVIEDGSRRRHWANELCRALMAENQGQTGELQNVILALLRDMSHPLTPLHELQRVITGLRKWSHESKMRSSIEDSFNEARLLVADETTRREAERSQMHEAILEQLRLSGEQLATTLTMDALMSALLTLLPRFGISNSMVSLYVDGDSERLETFVGTKDGAAFEPTSKSYAAQLLLPDEMLQANSRRSLTVMPLTFQAEQLGVTALELLSGFEVSTLLREQIGSAIKTVRMHEEKLNQERLKAQAQEERRVAAERLRSLNLIAGGVAHDLNNALGPLVALPEAILRELQQEGSNALSKDVIEDLVTIQQAGQRAALTIRDLLSLGHPSSNATTTCELNRLLQSEIDTWHELCESEAEIVLKVTTHTRPLVVRSSKPHLVRALSNLILNAVDAIQGPGAITLRTFEAHVAARLEGIECVEPGDYAVIEVHDTGSGIPQEDLPRVLEPFFTARKRQGSTGTGLGLSIVQRIVKDCMGYLHVESQTGQGTKFGLYFPVLAECECSPSDKPPQSVRGRGRILVVDDEAIQLRTAARILTQLGYEVVTASSGEEAINIFNDDSGDVDFDVVLMDVLMPGGMGGIVTVEHIRMIRPRQRVIMVTGYAPEQAEGNLNYTDVLWLSKPYSAGALASTVHGSISAATICT